MIRNRLPALILFALISTPVFAGTLPQPSNTNANKSVPAPTVTAPIPATTAPAPSVTPPEPLDRIVARVNDKIITEHELSQALRAAQDQYRESGVPVPPYAQLRKMILDSLIDQKLQLQLAEQANVVATDADIDKAIADIAKRNQATPDELKSKLEAGGMSYKEYRAHLGDQITVMKLQGMAVRASMKVSDEDVMTYKAKLQQNTHATQYRVLDLLVPLSDSPTAAQIKTARAQADDALAKLRKGADFNKMAMLFAGNNTPANTDLGWRAISDLPGLFVNPVSNMKINEYSSPILAPNGFHIIKLVGKRAAPTNLTDDQIKQMIIQQRYQTAVKKWLDQIREQADVQLY